MRWSPPLPQLKLPDQLQLAVDSADYLYCVGDYVDEDLFELATGQDVVSVEALTTLPGGTFIESQRYLRGVLTDAFCGTISLRFNGTISQINREVVFVAVEFREFTPVIVGQSNPNATYSNLTGKMWNVCNGIMFSIEIEQNLPRRASVTEGYGRVRPRAIGYDYDATTDRTYVAFNSKQIRRYIYNRASGSLVEDTDWGHIDFAGAVTGDDISLMNVIGDEIFVGVYNGTTGVVTLLKWDVVSKGARAAVTLPSLTAAVDGVTYPHLRGIGVDSNRIYTCQQRNIMGSVGRTLSPGSSGSSVGSIEVQFLWRIFSTAGVENVASRQIFRERGEGNEGNHDAQVIRTDNASTLYFIDNNQIGRIPIVAGQLDFDQREGFGNPFGTRNSDIQPNGPDGDFLIFEGHDFGAGFVSIHENERQAFFGSNIDVVTVDIQPPEGTLISNVSGSGVSLGQTNLPSAPSGLQSIESATAITANESANGNAITLAMHTTVQTTERFHIEGSYVIS